MQPVAYVRFTDTEWRPIYEDDRGQFVIDEGECKVRGVGHIPRDECDRPALVPTREPGN